MGDVPSAPYHHGELRPALIAAALDALDRDGELPSWRALARACSVSHTAPYRHFQSYEDLQAALAAECFRRLAKKIDAARARPTAPFDKLRAGSAAYIAFGRAHPAWYRLMFEHVNATDESRAAGAAAYATLVDAIASCGVREPLPIAASVWAAQHGVVDLLRLKVRAPGLHGDEDALIERVLDSTVSQARVAIGKRR